VVSASLLVNETCLLVNEIDVNEIDDDDDDEGERARTQRLRTHMHLSLSLSLSLQERALPLARSPVITNHVESVELEIEQQLNIGDEEEERFFDLKMLDFENEIKDLD